MKPIVGVMPLWDDERDSIWMLPGYMDSIADAGAIPVMFPLKADEEDLGQLCDLCDGFLFTGGHDVSPELYGELPVEELGTVCTPRDEMELVVMRNAMKADKPLLGICRGIQFVNVALGGSLYQDLPTQHPSQTQHQQLAPYDKPIHHVEVLTGTPPPRPSRHGRLAGKQLSSSGHQVSGSRARGDGGIPRRTY